MKPTRLGLDVDPRLHTALAVLAALLTLASFAAELVLTFQHQPVPPVIDQVAGGSFLAALGLLTNPDRSKPDA